MRKDCRNNCLSFTIKSRLQIETNEHGCPGRQAFNEIEDGLAFRQGFKIRPRRQLTLIQNWEQYCQDQRNTHQGVEKSSWQSSWCSSVITRLGFVVEQFFQCRYMSALAVGEVQAGGIHRRFYGLDGLWLGGQGAPGGGPRARGLLGGRAPFPLGGC